MGFFGPSYEEMARMERSLIARIRKLEANSLTLERAQRHDLEVVKAEMNMRELLSDLLKEEADPKRIARELTRYINTKWPRFIPATDADIPHENVTTVSGVGGGEQSVKVYTAGEAGERA